MNVFQITNNGTADGKAIEVNNPLRITEERALWAKINPKWPKS